MVVHQEKLIQTAIMVKSSSARSNLETISHKVVIGKKVVAS